MKENMYPVKDPFRSLPFIRTIFSRTEKFLYFTCFCTASFLILYFSSAHPHTYTSPLTPWLMKNLAIKGLPTACNLKALSVTRNGNNTRKPFIQLCRAAWEPGISLFTLLHIPLNCNTPYVGMSSFVKEPQKKAYICILNSLIQLSYSHCDRTLVSPSSICWRLEALLYFGTVFYYMWSWLKNNWAASTQTDKILLCLETRNRKLQLKS